MQNLFHAPAYLSRSACLVYVFQFANKQDIPLALVYHSLTAIQISLIKIGGFIVTSHNLLIKA